MANFYKKDEIPAHLLEFFVPAEIGLELTPDAFITNLIDVFREVRRVLSDDGTLWLNISDSYFHKNPSGPQGKTGARQGRRFTAEGAGARRAAACDTSGKAPANSPDRDCLCESLCDVCRKAYQIGKSHSDGSRVPTQSPLPCATNPVHTELQTGHLPTLDSLPQACRNLDAIACSEQKQGREFSPSLESQASNSQESSSQLQGGCLQEPRPVVGCLLCGHSLPDSIQGSAYMSGCTCGNEGRGLEDCNQGMGVLDLAYQYSTTEALKPKDLIGIPWMLAFALRADGWYLRQEIIWAKPNPMPESVTDRCTKSHESIFLLAKSEKYYCDMAVIKEPVKNDWGTRDRTNGKYHNDGSGLQPHGGLEKSYETANKRSVWTIATTPYKGAHFATFPTALIEPCILAGAPAGGVVLDPFFGSGTTGEVAQNLGRKFIGCELNPAYKALQDERLRQPSLDLEFAA